MALTLLFWKL